jgi:hypothetical protein
MSPRRLLVILLSPLLLLGCQGFLGKPSPSASAKPYDPNLLTVQRQGEADRWAQDVVRRKYVEAYMTAICTPDGPWAQMNAAWGKQQASVWSDILWRFEPIPESAATTSGGAGLDINALLNAALKFAPLVTGALKAAPASPVGGLPPC